MKGEGAKEWNNGRESVRVIGGSEMGVTGGSGGGGIVRFFLVRDSGTAGGKVVDA